ncbi:MAG TPA: hypothetical protein VJ372_23320 [Pyrinomonadaceae bacterium]|nr:hypothetical protein [Pyrinomonadaceae bacterium]
MLKPFTMAVLVISTLAALCLAQEPPPNNSTQVTPTRATLKLEVNYNPALRRTYIDIRGLEAKPAWIWVTRFVRISDWRLPQGALPIRAVRLEPQFNGETTEVTVTLLRGQRSVVEQEELLGKFRLNITSCQPPSSSAEMAFQSERKNPASRAGSDHLHTTRPSR